MYHLARLRICQDTRDALPWLLVTASKANLQMPLICECDAHETSYDPSVSALIATSHLLL